MTVSPLVYGYYCNYGNIWLIGPMGTLRGVKPDVAVVAVLAVLATGRINMPRSQPSFLDTARHGTTLTPWRGPADLRKGAPPSPVLVEPQPPWERTSTTVDGLGSQSECNPLPGPSDCHQDQPGAPGISVHTEARLYIPLYQAR